MARFKKSKKVNPDDLAPMIASGLTQGASAREALEEHPVSSAPSGIEIARNFAAADRRADENLRDKSVHFIARLDTETEIIEPNTGRRMIDAHKIIPATHRAQIASGYRCIECLEPFDVAYPTMCEVCGFAVRDRQMMRAMVEFEGDVHIGPSKPIRELLSEQDERMRKRDFVVKVLEGGQGKIPREWLSDGELMAGLSARHRAAIRAFV